MEVQSAFLVFLTWPEVFEHGRHVQRLAAVCRPRSPPHQHSHRVVEKAEHSPSSSCSLSHSRFSLAGPLFSPARTAAAASCQPWPPAHHRRSPMPSTCSFLLTAPPSRCCGLAARCRRLLATTSSRTSTGAVQPPAATTVHVAGPPRQARPMGEGRQCDARGPMALGGHEYMYM